jgi:DNA-binding NarL/FixJ family response regulator
MLTSEYDKRKKEKERAAFILNSHILFGESLKCLLKSMKLFTVILQSNAEEDMWQALRSGSISHLFLDYHLPGLMLAHVLRKIKNDFREIKPVVLSASQNIFIAQRLLVCGAGALVGKSTGLQEFAVCLHAVDIGRVYVSADIRVLLKEHGNQLHPIRFTDKEIQILQFIADGFTIMETAELLHVSKHTVVAHRRHMMEKTGVNSATGLVKFGMDAGLIQ